MRTMRMFNIYLNLKQVDDFRQFTQLFVHLYWKFQGGSLKIGKKDDVIYEPAP